MPDPLEYLDDPAGFFADLSQQLVADHDVLATLDRISRTALVVIPHASFCGITVRRRRARFETLAYTDEMALRCDELQYELDEGPCVSSAEEDEPFLVRSTAQDERWPRWGPRVADLGVNSIVSAQMSAASLDPEREPLGAINVYGRPADAFDADDLRRLHVFGVHAGHALAMAHMVTTLKEGIEARHDIGLAQGILMSRYEVNRDQAFESLRRYSSHANVKLREVATMVVDSGQLPASYNVADPIV